MPRTGAAFVDEAQPVKLGSDIPHHNNDRATHDGTRRRGPTTGRTVTASRYRLDATRMRDGGKASHHAIASRIGLVG